MLQEDEFDWVLVSPEIVEASQESSAIVQRGMFSRLSSSLSLLLGDSAEQHSD